MSEAQDLKRVTQEIRGRLAAKGIVLDGRENPEELVDVEEAVERFEKAVERRGGDLMMDEGIDRAAREPDDAQFALPVRQPREPIAAYLGRLEQATSAVLRRMPRS